MAREVTDIRLLAELEGIPTGTEVTDPETLRKLEGRKPIATEMAIRQVEKMPAWKKTALGIASPVLETVYGVGQLVTGEKPSPEKQHQLDVLRANSGWGTAGKVLGEIGLMAAPGGVIKAAAPKLAGRLSGRLATDVAASSGVEALKAPTDDRSRSQAALEGGAAAVAGRAIAAPVQAIARGVRNVTPEAEQLMRQYPGVTPTPGQLKGGITRGIEERMKGLPFVGQQIKQREKEALEAWNTGLAQRALAGIDVKMPKGVAPGNETIAEVQDAFGREYDKIWKTTDPETGELVDKVFDLSKQQAGMEEIMSDAEFFLPPDVNKRALTRLQVADSYMHSKTKASDFERVDDELREFAKGAKAAGYSDEAQYYEQARELLRKGLPDETRERLSQLDDAYRQWVPVETAAGYVGAQEGILTPGQLQRGSRAASDTVRKRGYAAGKAPMQQEANLARNVLGNELPQVGPGTAEKILGPAALLMAPGAFVASLPGLIPYSKAGTKALAGKIKGQPTLRDLLEFSSDVGVTGGTVGAGLYKGTQE